jgi:glyoxylase-like metal-dependent hydrolase (beta-lactamase superfamily II)
MKTHTFSLIAAGLSMVGCAAYKPAVKPFEAPAASQPGWAEVLAHPMALEVDTLETGTVKVSRGFLLDLTNPAAKEWKDEDVWVPVFAHLVRHPTRGDYLVDTGFDHTFASSSHGNLGGLAFLFDIAKQPAGMDVKSQLDGKHAALKGVFFTHLHLDHTAGAPDLPHDIPYVAGPGTLQDAYDDIGGVSIHHLDGVKELQEIDFSKAKDMPPLGPSVDVLGDGSVWAIWAPGHSRGEVAYLLNAASGPVLLLGDASHTRWGFEHDVAPNKATDPVALRKSLAQLRALVAAYPQIRVVPGHYR